MEKTDTKLMVERHVDLNCIGIPGDRGLILFKDFRGLKRLISITALSIRKNVKVFLVQVDG